MDFDLTEEQRLMVDSVDHFFRQHFPPEEVRRRDRAHQPPDDLLPAMADVGFLGLPIPKRYGGLEQDWGTVALVHERIAYHAGMVSSLFNRAVCFGAMSLLTYGSERHREELLPKFVRGELLFSLGLSEPAAGSDAAALSTRARKVDGGWLVNGRKTWISGADTSHYILTACRTGTGERRHDGVTMLLVPGDAKGLAMTPLEKVGNNGLSSWDIGYDDVFVPDDAVLSEERRGFRHLMTTLKFSRAGQAANAVGQGQAAVDMALAHAKERVQFGQPIGQFQAVQHHLANMQTRVDQARLMLYHLAWLIAQGRPCRKEAAQAKLVASEMLEYVAGLGMQILASAGYSLDSDMQRIWRDARLFTFGEGTSELQRNIIAREMGL